MNFATLPYGEIYTNYAIPNNHILFNIALKSWLETIAPILNVGDVQFRIPAVLIALLTISAMFAFLVKRVGLATGFVVSLAFAASTPFAIYGTALRGYMLSILFVIAGIEFSIGWRETRSKTQLLLYALSALGALDVIPTKPLVSFRMQRPKLQLKLQLLISQRQLQHL